MSAASQAREIGAWVLRRRRRWRVQGESMAPDFVDGDLVLVAPAAPVVVGEVVVARHPYKNLMVIKRVASVDPNGYLHLTSPGGEDSSQFGRVPIASVAGVVTANLTRR